MIHVRIQHQSARKPPRARVQESASERDILKNNTLINTPKGSFKRQKCRGMLMDFEIYLKVASWCVEIGGRPVDDTSHNHMTNLTPA